MYQGPEPFSIRYPTNDFHGWLKPTQCFLNDPHNGISVHIDFNSTLSIHMRMVCAEATWRSESCFGRRAMNLYVQNRNYNVPQTYMSKIGIHSTILSLCTTNVFLAHDIGFARI